MRKIDIKTILCILVLIVASVLVSGCKAVTAETPQSADEKAKEQDSSDSKSEKGTEDLFGNPAENDASEDKENDDTGLSEDIYKEDAGKVFAEMSEWYFDFSSGTGAWGTGLRVKPDGSFTGSYYDSDMGSIGPGYENGTFYECTFSGKFSDNVRSAGPLMHCLSIESIEYENKPDTEEIIDGVLHKYTKPYGFEGLDSLQGDDAPLVFMEAGAVTSAINRDELDWISPTHFGTYMGQDWEYYEDMPEELPFAVLINTKDSLAFYSDNISGKNKVFLVNKVSLPGLTNTELTVNDDGTYHCVDENKDGTFRVINTCFKSKKEYDPFNNANELVSDALKELYGENAPSSDDVYVLSPKDAYETDYPKMAVNGVHSDYAFWTPDGDESRSSEGRFVVQSDHENDTRFVYAYIIETKRGDDSFPDTGFAGFYDTSLTLTGRSDNISSAGKGKGAVRSILTEMMTPEEGAVLSTEVLMVSGEDKELVRKYHLEHADFDDDYEMVYPDNKLHEYKLADGDATPFYVQYPNDGIHRLYTASSLEDYMGKASNENVRLMKLYLNEDDEVVYAYEMYTP